MRKTIAIIASVLLPAAASAVDLIPSHIVNLATAALDPAAIVVQAVYYTAGTPTYSAPTNRTAKVVCTADTCAAPSAEADSTDMDDWQGFSVTVEADSGKTLTAVGTIDCYVWDPTYGAYSYLQDLGLTVTCTGKRRCTTNGVWAAAPRGRITCVPTGIVTSATGGVTLYINAEKRK